MLVLLYMAGVVRFQGITEQGVTQGDSFGYLKEANRWAQGLAPDFMGRRFYRPAGHFVESLGVRIGGYNDYSVKVLQAGMDTLNIVLIFALAWMLCKNPWPALAAPLLYAFLPRVIYYARSEFMHNISATFVLVSLLFFVAFEKSSERRGTPLHLGLLPLALAGFFVGAAANSHPDLALLGLGYVLYLFIRYFSWAEKSLFAKRFLATAAVFTLGFCSIYLMGVIAFGFDTVREVFGRELRGAVRFSGSVIRTQSGQAHYDIGKPQLTYFIFNESFKYMFGKGLILPVLLLGCPIIMIGRKLLKCSDAPAAYLPVLLWFAYLAGYAMNISYFKPNNGRLFIPLVPCIALSVTYWYYVAIRAFLGKFSPLLFLPLAYLVFTTFPHQFKWSARSSAPYRSVYEAVKDRVDEHNRILISPVTIYSNDRGYQSEFYFGANAIYQLHLPLRGDYTIEALDSLVRQYDIGFIFIGTNLDKRKLRSARPKNNGWLSGSFEYTVLGDRKMLGKYVALRSGEVVKKLPRGTLYALGPAGPMTNRIVLEDSFEDWEAAASSWWTRAKPMVEKVEDATDGRLGLQIMPSPPTEKRGTRLQTRLYRKHIPEGSKLFIQMDAKAYERKLSFALYGRVNGKSRALSRASNGKSDWITHPGKGNWQTLSTSIQIPAKLELNSLRLIIMLRPGATRPAIIDDLSVHLVAPQSEADSVSGGSASEPAAAFDSRPEAISYSQHLIARERDRLGGWESWNTSLKPFRRDLARLLKRWTATGHDSFMGKNGFLFSAKRTRFLLEGDLTSGPGGGGDQGRPAYYESIVDVSRQLASKGIDLIFVPVPTRAEIYADYVADSAPTDRSVMPQRLRLIEMLLEAGVEVVDLAPTFRAARKADPSSHLFHPADTHWSSKGIRVAAAEIAQRLRRYDFVRSAASGDLQYTTRPSTCVPYGRGYEQFIDPAAEPYPKEDWPFLQVMTPSGDLYTNTETSPVIVAGDSFAQHLDPEHGGICSHIAAQIKMPLTLLFSSGGGPRVPQMIARKGPRYLEGRRVVVWVIVSRYMRRQLAPQWTRVELPLG